METSLVLEDIISRGEPHFYSSVVYKLSQRKKKQPAAEVIHYIRYSSQN